MRQVTPGIAIRAVIFSYRTPLPLGDIRPPKMPALFARIILLDAGVLSIHLQCFAPAIRNQQSAIKAPSCGVRQSPTFKLAFAASFSLSHVTIYESSKT